MSVQHDVALAFHPIEILLEHCWGHLRQSLELRDVQGAMHGKMPCGRLTRRHILLAEHPRTEEFPCGTQNQDADDESAKQESQQEDDGIANGDHRVDRKSVV